MGIPKHHDTNYFAQRIESRHNTDLEDMEKSLAEIHQIITGIEKGLTMLENIGKYPDQKVLENRNIFIELELQYRKKVEGLKS